jgi:hypothetical protein
MSAGRYSFVIEKQATFSKSMVWLSGGNPVNVTGYTGLMQIRSQPDGNGTLLATFRSGTPGAGEGSITFGGSNGTIGLGMSVTNVNALNWSGDAWYDLVVTSGGGTQTRLLEGRVTLSPAVTIP